MQSSKKRKQELDGQIAFFPMPEEANREIQAVGEARAAHVKKASAKKGIRKLDQWLKIEFESSCSKTDQFKAFSRQFCSELKKILPAGCTLTGYSTGHFYVSGFVYNEKTQKYAYFSISDVRSFRNEWYHHMLVRTARSNHDFTGGTNQYTPFYAAAGAFEKLTA